MSQRVPDGICTHIWRVAAACPSIKRPEHSTPDRIRTCICTHQKCVAYPLDYGCVPPERFERPQTQGRNLVHSPLCYGGIRIASIDVDIFPKVRELLFKWFCKCFIQATSLLSLAIHSLLINFQLIRAGGTGVGPVRQGSKPCVLPLD